jgi:hypothetical protein
VTLVGVRLSSCQKSTAVSYLSPERASYLASIASNSSSAGNAKSSSLASAALASKPSKMVKGVTSDDGRRVLGEMATEALVSLGVASLDKSRVGSIYVAADDMWSLGVILKEILAGSCSSIGLSYEDASECVL